MAVNMKEFFNGKRDNLLRLKTNIEGIIHKYDREFNDDTVVDLTDLSIHRGHKQFKKYSTNKFGHSKLLSYKKRGQTNSLKHEDRQSHHSYLSEIKPNKIKDEASFGNRRQQSELSHQKDKGKDDKISQYTVSFSVEESDNSSDGGSDVSLQTSEELNESDSDECIRGKFSPNKTYNVDSASTDNDEDTSYTDEINSNAASLEETYHEVLKHIASDEEEPSDAETLTSISDDSVYDSEDATEIFYPKIDRQWTPKETSLEKQSKTKRIRNLRRSPSGAKFRGSNDTRKRHTKHIDERADIGNFDHKTSPTKDCRSQIPPRQQKVLPKSKLEHMPYTNETSNFLLSPLTVDSDSLESGYLTGSYDLTDEMDKSELPTYLPLSSRHGIKKNYVSHQRRIKPIQIETYFKHQDDVDTITYSATQMKERFPRMFRTRLKKQNGHSGQTDNGSERNSYKDEYYQASGFNVPNKDYKKSPSYRSNDLEKYQRRRNMENIYQNVETAKTYFMPMLPKEHDSAVSWEQNDTLYIKKSQNNIAPLKRCTKSQTAKEHTAIRPLEEMDQNKTRGKPAQFVSRDWYDRHTLTSPWEENFDEPDCSSTKWKYSVRCNENNNGMSTRREEPHLLSYYSPLPVKVKTSDHIHEQPYTTAYHSAKDHREVLDNRTLYREDQYRPYSSTYDPTIKQSVSRRHHDDGSGKVYMSAADLTDIEHFSPRHCKKEDSSKSDPSLLKVSSITGLHSNAPQINSRVMTSLEKVEKWQEDMNKERYTVKARRRINVSNDVSSINIKENQKRYLGQEMYTSYEDVTLTSVDNSYKSNHIFQPPNSNVERIHSISDKKGFVSPVKQSTHEWLTNQDSPSTTLSKLRLNSPSQSRRNASPTCSLRNRMSSNSSPANSHGSLHLIGRNSFPTNGHGLLHSRNRDSSPVSGHSSLHPRSRNFSPVNSHDPLHLRSRNSSSVCRESCTDLSQKLSSPNVRSSRQLSSDAINWPTDNTIRPENVVNISTNDSWEPVFKMPAVPSKFAVDKKSGIKERSKSLESRRSSMSTRTLDATSPDFVYQDDSVVRLNEHSNLFRSSSQVLSNGSCPNSSIMSDQYSSRVKQTTGKNVRTKSPPEMRNDMSGVYTRSISTPRVSSCPRVGQSLLQSTPIKPDLKKWMNNSFSTIATGGDNSSDEEIMMV